MDGVNPFRLPRPPIHPFHAFSPDALIGPVWNRVIEGMQFWDLQGMVNSALNPITILEGNSKDIVISIDQQPTSNVTVVITGHGSTDLTVSPTTFTFTSGDWADQTATLTAGEDDDTINDELTLTITTTQGSDKSSVERAVTIVDDEIIWELTPVILEESKNLRILIPLLETLGPPSGDVTFTITGQGTRLITNPTTLTFPAEDWQRSQPLVLLATLDDDDRDDRVTLTFSAAGGGYDGLTYSLEVLIQDRPPYELVIPEGGSTTLSLTLFTHESPPQSDLTATYSGFEGTDLMVSPSTVTHTVFSWYWIIFCFDENGTWYLYCSPGESVTVVAGHDADEEDDQETLIFEVTGPAHETKFVGLSAQINIRIKDDDGPGLEVSPVSLDIPEGEKRSFSIRLEAAPPGDLGNNDVSVHIPQSKGDLTASPSSLTFTRANWDQWQDVELTARHDNDFQDDTEELTVTANGIGFDGKKGKVSVTIIDDEVPSLRVYPTRADVIEGEGWTTVYVALTEKPTGEVTVEVPPFTNPTLQHNRPRPITFELSDGIYAWWRHRTVTVWAEEDADAMDEFESITLRARGGGYDGATHPLRVLAYDDDVAGARLVVDPISVSVDEGSTAEFTVKLSTEPEGTVIVRIPTFTNPDLAHDQPTLTFTSSTWSAPQTVTVSAAEDANMVDESESIRLTASGGGYGGATRAVAVTVIDNDVAAVRLEVDPTSVSVDEGSTAEITVKLSAEPTGQVTVRIPPFTDPALGRNPSTLSFTPSTWDAPQTVTVSSAEDANTVNESESITLTASGGGYDEASQAVTVTVIDNDLTGIELIPSSLSVTEGYSETYSVRLLSAPAEPVTLNIAESSGSVAVSPLVLHFAASNWDESQQVTVQADRDDNSISETSTLIHTATSVDPDYSGMTATLPVTVIDRDVPRLEVTPGALTIGEGTSGEFTVELASEPTVPVTVRIPAFTNPELTHDQPTLTFTPSTWDVPQAVTVSATADEDAEDEAPETLTLRASGGEYDGITGAVTVTVEDTNQKGILLNPHSLELQEGGPAGAYTVVLQSAPTSDVTVTITGSSVEVPLDRESLTFTPTTWYAPQTVTVQALEDEDTDNEQYTLTHNASGGGYDNETAHLEVRVIDRGEVLLLIYDAQVLEGDGQVDVRVELNQPTDQLVSVMYRAVAGEAEAGSDYEDSRGIVLFNPGATNGKVRLDILDDEIPELDETFTVVLSNARNAVIARRTGRVTIVDDQAGVTARIDDGVAFEEDGRIQFTVHLSQPSATPVTVSYRTENGTATAGEDYEAASGMLTFAPGVVQEEITVELLTDALDWREETFTVRLQSSDKTRIEKAVAVATIREETPVHSGILKAYTARFVRTSTIQIVEALHQRFRSRTDASSCSAAQRAVMAQIWGATTGWDPSPGELLAGCHVSRGMGGLSAWGRGAFTRFNGHGEDALRIRADVTTAMVGADYRWRQAWLAGVLVSHSQGDGSFRVYEESGVVQSGLTGVVPYVSVQGADWGAWMAMGYGRGRAEVQELEGDLASTFGAAGVQGEWASNASVGLTVHGDVLFAGAQVDAHAVRAQVYRVRAGLGG